MFDLQKLEGFGSVKRVMSVWGFHLVQSGKDVLSSKVAKFKFVPPKFAIPKFAPHRSAKDKFALLRSAPHKPTPFEYAKSEFTPSRSHGNVS